MKNKVYIVNNSGHDYSKAKAYGEPVNVTEGKVNIFATDRLQNDIRQKISGITDNDYIVLSGYSLINVLTVMMAAQIAGKVNLLIYNFNSEDYILRQFTKEELTLTKAVFDGINQVEEE